MRGYINFATFHGLVQFLFFENHDTVIEILTILYHTITGFTREEVLAMVKPNYKVVSSE